MVASACQALALWVPEVGMDSHQGGQGEGAPHQVQVAAARCSRHVTCTTSYTASDAGVMDYVT